jgi:hypothetical protein
MTLHFINKASHPKFARTFVNGEPYRDRIHNT